MSLIADSAISALEEYLASSASSAGDLETAEQRIAELENEANGFAEAQNASKERIESLEKQAAEKEEEAAGALRGNLLELEEKVEVWLGSLEEARAREVVAAVLPFASGFRFFQPAQPRACSCDWLVGLIPKGFAGTVSDGDMSRVDEYLDAASETQVILVTGSIYLIGEYLSLVSKTSSTNGSKFQDIL